MDVFTASGQEAEHLFRRSILPEIRASVDCPGGKHRLAVDLVTFCGLHDS